MEPSILQSAEIPQKFFHIEFQLSVLPNKIYTNMIVKIGPIQ